MTTENSGIRGRLPTGIADENRGIRYGGRNGSQVPVVPVELSDDRVHDPHRNTEGLT